MDTTPDPDVAPKPDECCATCVSLGTSAGPTRYCPKHGLIMSEDAAREVWCLAWTEKGVKSDAD